MQSTYEDNVLKKKMLKAFSYAKIVQLFYAGSVNFILILQQGPDLRPGSATLRLRNTVCCATRKKTANQREYTLQKQSYTLQDVKVIRCLSRSQETRYRIYISEIGTTFSKVRKYIHPASMWAGSPYNQLIIRPESNWQGFRIIN